MPERITDIELKLLLEAINLRYHYDFRGYSVASVKRRLLQAKLHFQCESFFSVTGSCLARTGTIARTDLLPDRTSQ